MRHMKQSKFWVWAAWAAMILAIRLEALEPIPTPSQPKPDVSQADKSDYNLFNPTPRELMREMSTDRPDTTESPYTVDAGHYQVEMSFVDYVHDRYNPERADQRVETFTAAPMPPEGIAARPVS